MKRFRDILFVATPQTNLETALERAVALAENNQAKLTAVDVLERATAGFGMPVGGPMSTELRTAMVRERQQKLDNLIEPYSKRIAIQTEVLTGTPFLEVIRDVLRNGRDLVIKTPEITAWQARIFGSDDMHILRKCPCPVWLIKPDAPKPFRRILAAVDMDEAYRPPELKTRRALNRQILEMAVSLALSEFAELHVVHVWWAIGEDAMRGAFIRAPQEKILAYLEQVRSQHEASSNSLMREVTQSVGADALKYLKPRTHLVKGLARKEIPALAKLIEADIIVMGTVARVGVPGFIIGNTAETILNHIDCSVIAIKPPGFATPVTLES